MFDRKTFTYGYEIEWGDVDRSVNIPEHLGAWEYCETDIVNLREPYKGLASDPHGINPPVGGEINTKPTRTVEQQVDNIMQLHDMFVKHGTPPTAACVNHGQLHVHVPGLIEDINALKRLAKYIKANQKITIDNCYKFKYHNDMSETSTANLYLRYDGGRLLPDWLLDKFMTVDSFEEWLNVYDEHVVSYRSHFKNMRLIPYRYGININSLRRSKTVEFRCFRSSVKKQEIHDSLKFAGDFMEAALNDGPSVKELMNVNEYNFAPFEYDHEIYVSWETTKYGRKTLDKSLRQKLNLTSLGKSQKYIEASD